MFCKKESGREVIISAQRKSVEGTKTRRRAFNSMENFLIQLSSHFVILFLWGAALSREWKKANSRKVEWEAMRDDMLSSADIEVAHERMKNKKKKRWNRGWIRKAFHSLNFYQKVYFFVFFLRKCVCFDRRVGWGREKFSSINLLSIKPECIPPQPTPPLHLIIKIKSGVIWHCSSLLSLLLVVHRVKTLRRIVGCLFFFLIRRIIGANW